MGGPHIAADTPIKQVCKIIRGMPYNIEYGWLVDGSRIMKSTPSSYSVEDQKAYTTVKIFSTGPDKHSPLVDLIIDANLLPHMDTHPVHVKGKGCVMTQIYYREEE